MYRIGSDDLCGIAGEVLGKGSTLAFIAGGVSMAPFIEDGDTVVVQPAGSLRIGDVILCKTTEGVLLLHRVIKITGTGIVTRGDACRADDGVIPPENVMGKASKVTGKGFNFHLHFPFRRLLAWRGTRLCRLFRRPLLFGLAKRLAYFLG
jgi:signal peptidase I